MPICPLNHDVNRIGPGELLVETAGGGERLLLIRHLIGKPVAVSDTGETVLLYESKRAGESLRGDESDVDLRHAGAGNFVFLDGHVERLKEVPGFEP